MGRATGRDDDDGPCVEEWKEARTPRRKKNPGSVPWATAEVGVPAGQEEGHQLPETDGPEESEPEVAQDQQWQWSQRRIEN